MPDFEYCSAFGDTPEEALVELLIAKSGWIETARELGIPIPEPRYRPAPARPRKRRSASARQATADSLGGIARISVTGAITMRREKVLTALSQHCPRLAGLGVKSLRLFGSVARDEASAASDVDLLVAFDHSPSYSEFMRLKILFEDLLGARVDLVTEHGLRARVRPSVERDAILVA